MRFEKITKRQFLTDCAGKYGFSYDDIKLPKRGTAQSAGYDFFSPIDITLLPGESIKMPTGIKFRCDPNKFLGAYPRSGHGFKYGVMLVNTVGIIDADYYNNPGNEGHIWVKLVYPPHASVNIDPLVIKKGEAVFQGIIQPYYTVEDDDADGERTGGFGSTDKKVLHG